jgi:hypothetical protein
LSSNSAASCSVIAPAFADNNFAPMAARAISSFKVGSTETRFGSFEFVGGLELDSANPLFGAVSSIRFRPDGRQFLSVLDTGHWLSGAIERDASGRLSGMTDAVIAPMLDATGRSPRSKQAVDAEGLALRNGQAIVSFEQRHRIDVYPDPGFDTSKPLRTIPLLVDRSQLRANGGLETLAISPPASALAGAMVIVAEKSVDRNGFLLAAIVDGPSKGTFSVVSDKPFDVTDGAFLPDGDLLLLERRFNLSAGIGMRIRRIKGADIRAGAVVNGEVLLEADSHYQIDNMEGLDVIAGPDGKPHVILVSDDNHSIFQRSLMLEFKLVE